MTHRSRGYDSRSGPSDEEISDVVRATIGRPEEFDENVQRAEEHLRDYQELLIADLEEGELYDAEGRPLAPRQSGDLYDRVSGSSSLESYVTLSEQERGVGPPRDVSRAATVPQPEVDASMSAQNAAPEPLAELRDIARLGVVTGAPLSAALFYYAIVADVYPVVAASLGMLVASIVAGLAGVWYEFR